MTKALKGLFAAGTLIIAGTIGVAAFNSDADAAGNIPDTHSATVQITSNKGMCSGVYVGPQVVLTAKHCVENQTVIGVAPDHILSTSTTSAEIVWMAPGKADIALLRTPTQTVDYYAPISPIAPAINSSIQQCGINNVPRPGARDEVVEQAEWNYCGNVFIKENKHKTLTHGTLLIISPAVGAPGDSGGPLYDTEGTVQGVHVIARTIGFGDNKIYRDSAGSTPTYLYVDELRAHGAVVKGEGVEPPHMSTQVTSLTDGTYVITSALDNNKALDVNKASKIEGSNIQLWDRNNGAAQRFQITHLGHNVYKIINVNSGKSLDINGSSKDAGANLLQWRWTNSENQKFYITGMPNVGYTIQAVHSGMVLDVNGSRTANGTNVTQWTDNGTLNQRWNFHLQ